MATRKNLRKGDSIAARFFTPGTRTRGGKTQKVKNLSFSYYKVLEATRHADGTQTLHVRSVD